MRIILLQAIMSGSKKMTAHGTPNRDGDEKDPEGDRHAHSRRALLASIGTGVAGATLGGLTETASASGEDSSAGEFIESTSPATGTARQTSKYSASTRPPTSAVSPTRRRR